MRLSSTAWVIIVLLILASLPFLLAASLHQPDQVFAGFLFNPVDATSYLAKMRQGWEGNWLFRLPYTPGVFQPQPIYLYYLFLGQLARWTGFSLLAVYHIARLVNAAVLTASLALLYRVAIPDPGKARFALFLAVFGSGLGWLFFHTGIITSDFWVAEAYPWLSALANPHFTLGLAILVLLLIRITIATKSPAEYLRLAVGALALAVIFPFAAAVLLAVAGVWAAWESIEQHRLVWHKPLMITLGGMPYLVYQYILIQSDPALNGWNQQNLTISPPWWDVIVSFSPALLSAAAGAVFILRNRYSSGRILLVWAVVSLGMVIMPFNLQRRFLLGLYIPLAGLAVYGWMAISRRGFFQRRTGLILMILSLPTSILVLLSGISGAVSADRHIYLSTNEVQMMEWMLHNLDEGEVILASPETGLFIPAWAGQQVIYGHPFETVNAAVNKELVEDVLSGGLPLDQFSQVAGIHPDYLFWGPREMAFSSSPPAGLGAVQSIGDVTLYKVP